MDRRASARNIRSAEPIVQQIRQSRPDIARLRERARAGEPLDDLLVDVFAAVCEAARQSLRQDPFDVQLIAGIAMHHGQIAEMLTGEGKTLAAVFPACLHALSGEGFHVLTVNDYLARRDAQWMRPIYKSMGLSVAYIQEGMTVAERQAAYAADVTYATANEIGFDYLRDHLASDPTQLVQRAFQFALIDEADSILIDEARIPLVIAGGASPTEDLPHRMVSLAHWLVPGRDYTRDEYSRNVQLTETGSRRAEMWLRCSNLYDLENLALLTALNHALHAKELLRRDVDYVVKDGRVELVDEFKGRIVHDRRWPDGLQAALEAKEGVRVRTEGRVLATLTVQNLVDLYPYVAGMTATALTQAEELTQVYDLPVVAIPPNRENIRKDYEDVLFTHRAAKEKALIEEIHKVHATGRPILVGTASVAESERLGRALKVNGVSNQILNARNHEQEAAIIAQAGALGAVTISTNMAGRGTDILLGGNPPQQREQVLALGGLYVIGTNKHESRRIDNQLRGRAGRQGDPGSSIFFVSLEDDLISRFGVLDLLPPIYRQARHPVALHDPAVVTEVNRAQRIIESQNLEIRRRLWRYEGVLEDQRRILHARRRAVLMGEPPPVAESRKTEVSILNRDPEDEVDHRSLLERRCPERYAELGALAPRVERQITLGVIDELWSDYLLRVTELREGIHWVSLAGHDPVNEFRKSAIEMFDQLLLDLDESVVRIFEEHGENIQEAGLLDTSSTWTYIINDQPMGDLAQRFFKGLWKRQRP
jgi:preprotein translocase subunit SecA